MKITKAWIDDPTEDGVLEPPVLLVEVDEFPSETQEPIVTNDGWTMSKYGPFVSYDREPDINDPEPDAGDYNVRFAGKFAPIVDIDLIVKKSTDKVGTHHRMFALPITRARQLIRKWEKDWRLYLSDKDAQEGAMVWIPQCAAPTCKFWLGSKTCGRGEKVTFVRHHGIDLPFCAEHLAEHNARCADHRRTSPTSK